MNLKFLLAVAVVGVVQAQNENAMAQHYHHTHGQATSRHCQTDYDHRPHYYHSGTHYHYCPGGAHFHGGGHSHGGKRYAAAYDPVVVEIQRVLQKGGYYDHDHHQTDGIYGPETAQAIRSYQTANGLEVTGRINSQLLTAMGITAPNYGGAVRVGAAPQPNGDILTPAEAAVIMKVTESDVVILLEKGDLGGKKIGSSWRISREAINEFMKSNS